jgi:hypothetical protein
MLIKTTRHAQAPALHAKWARTSIQLPTTAARPGGMRTCLWWNSARGLRLPERARSLFTVRAAICLARPVLAPRLLALALTCWYCRSRLELDAAGIATTRDQRFSRLRRNLCLRPRAGSMPRSRRNDHGAGPRGQAPCPGRLGTITGRAGGGCTAAFKRARTYVTISTARERALTRRGCAR